MQDLAVANLWSGLCKSAGQLAGHNIKSSSPGQHEVLALQRLTLCHESEQDLTLSGLGMEAIRWHRCAKAWTMKARCFAADLHLHQAPAQHGKHAVSLLAWACPWRNGWRGPAASPWHCLLCLGVGRSVPGLQPNGLPMWLCLRTSQHHCQLLISDEVDAPAMPAVNV